MDTGKSSLNPSSLLDLKAELHKKNDLLQRTKLSQESVSSKSSAFKYKGQKIAKEKTVSQVSLKSNAGDDEEELALRKSQLALEAKAKLYDQITSRRVLIDDDDDEEGGRFLVDFNRKVLYAPMPERAERVERNEPIVKENSTCSETSSTFKKADKEIPVTSNYKADKLEENDQPVHYQNVQFNEVRDHGTGYFAFSMDEETRKEQMRELKKLRQQTEDQILVEQRMQRKRKAMIEARLAKVCERRNIDKSVIQNYTNTAESTDDSNQKESVDLSSIPLPETSEAPKAPEKKEVKVRPWDIGKTDFPAFVPEERKIKSQNTWLEERRSERSSEFAPPSSY